MATLFASVATFYVQTWEEYHTHTLTLGLVNGPVEGLLVLVAVFAMTGFVGGAHFWQQPMLPALGLPPPSESPSASLLPDLAYRLSFTEWYMALGFVVLVFNTVESVRNVMHVTSSRTAADAAAAAASDNKNQKKKSTHDQKSGHNKRSSKEVSPVDGLAPFVATWALVAAYLVLQPGILHGHLVPFALFVGLVNAYAVGRIITAHLVHLDFPYANVLTLPLAAAVLDSLGPWLRRATGGTAGWPSALGDDVYQVAAMFCMLGVAIGVYGSFVVDVIVTICDYLDIWCLTIKHPIAAK